MNPLISKPNDCNGQYFVFPGEFWIFYVPVLYELDKKKIISIPHFYNDNRSLMGGHMWKWEMPQEICSETHQLAFCLSLHLQWFPCFLDLPSVARRDVVGMLMGCPRGAWICSGGTSMSLSEGNRISMSLEPMHASFPLSVEKLQLRGSGSVSQGHSAE